MECLLKKLKITAQKCPVEPGQVNRSAKKGNGPAKPKDVLINLKPVRLNTQLFSVLKVASSLKATGLAYFKAAVVERGALSREANHWRKP